MMLGRITPGRLANAVLLALIAGSITLVVHTIAEYGSLGRDELIAALSDGFTVVGWVQQHAALAAVGAVAIGVALVAGLAASRSRHTDARHAEIRPAPDSAPASLLQLRLLAPHLSDRQSLAAELLRLAVRGGARLTADRQGRLLLEPTGRTAGLDPELERLAQAVFGERGGAVALDDPRLPEALRTLQQREARRLRRSGLLRRDPYELRGVLLRLLFGHAAVCAALHISIDIASIGDEDGFLRPLLIVVSILLVLSAFVTRRGSGSAGVYTTTPVGAASARAVLDSIVELRQGERLAQLPTRRLADLLPIAVAFESPQAVIALLQARWRAGETPPDWLGGELRNDLGGVIRAMRIAFGSPEGEWRRAAAPQPPTFRGRPVHQAEYDAYLATVTQGRPQRFEAWRQSRATT